MRILVPNVAPPTLILRVIWGIRWGALFGIAFVAIAVVIDVLSGSSAFESHHTTFGKTAASYVSGGMAAGLVVGLMQPITRWKAGAAFVGFVAAVPVAILFHFATHGFGPWHVSDTIMALIFCLILGAPTGVVYREIFLEKAD